MRRASAVILLLLMIAGVVAHLEIERERCARAGGLLVRGVFTLTKCVHQ